MGKTMAVGVHCIIALLILFGADLVRSDGSDHRYKEGDFVPLYANKVGAFHNPSETYGYFDLPFCSPDAVKEKGEALGEVLNGDRLVRAPYKLEFLRHKDPEVACKKTLTKEEVARFRSAVNKDYYFQMYYDDLPIWGFIGKVDKEGKDPSEYKTYLYKHIQFDLYYNKDRVIEVNVRTDPNALVDLSEDKEVDVEFMYTVEWKETTTAFDKRMDKYSQSSSLPPLVSAYELYTVTKSLFTIPRFNPKDKEGLERVRSSIEGLHKQYDTYDKFVKASEAKNWIESLNPPPDATNFTPIPRDAPPPGVQDQDVSPPPSGVQDQGVSPPPSGVQDQGVSLRVTSLNFSSLGLSGPIPDFSSMDALEEIDFHNNYLNGSIPDFLGSFSNLKLLDLSGNRFTGSIPASLSNKQNLELHVNDNCLDGTPCPAAPPSRSGGKECSTDKLQMILGGIILFYMLSNY